MRRIIAGIAILLWGAAALADDRQEQGKEKEKGRKERSILHDLLPSL